MISWIHAKIHALRARRSTLVDPGSILEGEGSIEEGSRLRGAEQILCDHFFGLDFNGFTSGSAVAGFAQGGGVVGAVSG